MAGTVPRPGGCTLALALVIILLITGVSHAPSSTAEATSPPGFSFATFPLSIPLPLALAAGGPLVPLPGQDAPPLNPTPPLSPESGITLPGRATPEADAPPNPDEPDNQPPTIDAKTPPHGATVKTDVPEVGFGYDDASGVAINTARITLDGAPMTTMGAAKGATARPAAPLAPGMHTLVATVRDNEGNEARAEWSFTVQLDPAPLRADGSSALTQLPGIPDAGVEIAMLRFVNGPLRQPLVTPLETVTRAIGLRDVATFDVRPDIATGGEAVIELHVAREWLAKQDAPPDRLVLRHEAPTGWEVLPLTLAQENATAIVVRALVSSFSPFSLAVDTVAPALERKSSLESTVAGDVLLLDLAASDASGIRSILVTLDGMRVERISPSAHGFLVSVGPLEEGDHVMTAIVTDVAGNRAEETYAFTTGAADESAPSMLKTNDASAPGEPGDPPPDSIAPARISPLVGVAVVLAAGGIGGLGLALLRKGRT